MVLTLKIWVNYARTKTLNFNEKLTLGEGRRIGKAKDTDIYIFLNKYILEKVWSQE